MMLDDIDVAGASADELLRLVARCNAELAARAAAAQSTLAPATAQPTPASASAQSAEIHPVQDAVAPIPAAAPTGAAASHSHQSQTSLHATTLGFSTCINKIDEGFYICGVDMLRNFTQLRSLGIHCILNAAGENLYTDDNDIWTELHGSEDPLMKLKDNFDVKIIGAEDIADFDLSIRFQEIADFVEAGRSKGGVVVHCQAGISRACTSACAYLMIKQHWDLEGAFRRVQQVRSFVYPNKGFWRQLRDLEVALKAEGIQLKTLPDAYEAPTQPEGQSEDPKLVSDACAYDTIRLLDAAARSVSSFVTKPLTATINSMKWMKPSGVISNLKMGIMDGVVIQSATLDKKGAILLHASVVPSLSPDGFKALLLELPGVRLAVVEGETVPVPAKSSKVTEESLLPIEVKKEESLKPIQVKKEESPKPVEVKKKVFGGFGGMTGGFLNRIPAPALISESRQRAHATVPYLEPGGNHAFQYYVTSFTLALLACKRFCGYQKVMLGFQAPLMHTSC